MCVVNDGRAWRDDLGSGRAEMRRVGEERKAGLKNVLVQGKEGKWPNHPS